MKRFLPKTIPLFSPQIHSRTLEIMTLPKLTHEPGTVVNFFEDALNHLGALCERTWYDRLEIVAEGRSARLWNDASWIHPLRDLEP